MDCPELNEIVYIYTDKNAIFLKILYLEVFIIHPVTKNKKSGGFNVHVGILFL